MKWKKTALRQPRADCNWGHPQQILINFRLNCNWKWKETALRQPRDKESREWTDWEGRQRVLYAGRPGWEDKYSQYASVENVWYSLFFLFFYLKINENVCYSLFFLFFYGKSMKTYVIHCFSCFFKVLHTMALLNSALHSSENLEKTRKTRNNIGFH